MSKAEQGEATEIGTGWGNEGIDLGHKHMLWFFSWKPDRKLNPQYQHLPDLIKAGARVMHLTKEGEECASGIYFDSPAAREVFGGEHSHFWQVASWQPLTVSPSLLCMRCGDHGFIRNGKWEAC